MNPWIPLLVMSIVGAALFFGAGYFTRRAREAEPAAEPAVPRNADLPALLRLLTHATKSEAAALLDSNGLPIHAVGPADERTQALAGTIAAALMDARDHGLADVPAVFELSDASGYPIRLRCATLADEVFVVATFRAEGAPAPQLEREIVAAVPRFAGAA